MVLERQRELDGNIHSDDIPSQINLSKALICLSSQGRRDPNSVKLRHRRYLFPTCSRESLGKN
jgi:hypothetical protein